MNRTKLERLRGEIVEGGARFVTTEGVLKVLDAMLAEPPAVIPMPPRCDGCRYWVKKSPEHISGEWVPHIGPREDPNAQVIGWCRRYPQLQGKAPGDWCGEFAAIPGTKIENPILEAP